MTCKFFHILQPLSTPVICKIICLKQPNSLQQLPAGSSSRKCFSLTKLAVSFLVQNILPVEPISRKINLVKFRAMCFRKIYFDTVKYCVSVEVLRAVQMRIKILYTLFVIWGRADRQIFAEVQSSLLPISLEYKRIQSIIRSRY